VVVTLGRIGFDSFLKAWGDAGRKLPAKPPRFSHAAEVKLPGGVMLLASTTPASATLNRSPDRRDVFGNFPPRQSSHWRSWTAALTSAAVVW